MIFFSIQIVFSHRFKIIHKIHNPYIMNLIFTSIRTFLYSSYKRILIVLFFLSTCLLGFSQGPMFYTSTALGGGNAFPFSSTGYRCQWLYAPYQFSAGGTGSGVPAGSGFINKIYVLPSSTSTGSYVTFTVRIGYGTSTSLSSGGPWITSGMQTCLSATTINITSTANSWCAIPLTTPFYYTPSNYLIIDISQVSATSGFTINQLSPGLGSTRAYGLTANSTNTGADGTQANMGFDLQANTFNDAGVLSIDSPMSFCGGIQNIKATIKNYGRNQINPVTVNWSLDGNIQTPITYSSLLDTAGVINNTAQVLLGSYNFPGLTSLKVWTSQPNNVADTNAVNDTLVAIKGPALSGAYTINPSGTGPYNFLSFSSFASVLNTGGVCGPVTVTVAAGTYNEQVMFGNITGASAINTILIDGVDTATRTLTYATSSKPAVIQFNGAQYVTVKNLSIINTNTVQNTSGYYGVHFTNAANYNKLLGCRVQVPVFGAGGALYPIAVAICGGTYSTTGNTGNYNTIDGNRMIGGYYGMTVFGNATAPSTSTGNVITNNKIEKAYYMGVYLYFQSNLTFDHNVITNGPYYTNDYGIYAYYLNNTSISRNKVNSSYYGLYLYTYTSYNTGTMNITNNMFYSQGGGTTYYGMYMSNANNAIISHNTVYHTKASGAAYYDFLSYPGNKINNNVFVVSQATATAFYVANASTTYFLSIDYNTIASEVGNANLAYFLGVYYPSIGTLKTSNLSFNQNNNGVVPIFQNLGDLHLSTTLDQARGMSGTGIAIDIDGEPRCVLSPSMGADESNYVPPAISAGFTAGTVYINSPITLINNYSANTAMSHRWFVDGAFVGTTVNLNYTFTTLGSHCVSIKSTNCFGSDSVNICLNIISPTAVPTADFVASPSSVLTNQNLTLVDMSSNGPSNWLWSISPGTVGVNYYYTGGTSATSRNPIVYFTTPGLYTVCMKSTNGIGTSALACKNNYITVVIAQAMCSAPFSTKLATGNLYSSGGPAGGYGQNENCIFSIDACADSTFLNVTSATFGTAAVDRFEIYEGDYIPGKTPVAQFIGGTTYNNLPQLIRVKGKMTVREITDGTANNGQGIKANWYITAGNFPAPTGTIIGSNDAYVCPQGIYNFYSSSFRDPSYLYEWDFDNDGLTDMTGMDGYFSFAAAGPDTIKLKVKGCGGNALFTKFVNIISPSKPTAAFNTNLFIATNIDTVQLNDATTGGVTSWKWTITGPGPVLFVGGTNNTSRNPRLMGNVTGTYTVKLVVTNCSGSDSVTVSNYFKILSYCIPTAGNLLADLSISNFQMGSINNTISTPAPGTVAYRDFTQTTFSFVDRGASYPFSITRAANNNAAGIRIWVDWNQDGSFDPITELAASTITGNMNWSSSIATPKTAALGGTRLRIGVSFNNMNNTPCGANMYGEFQDYRLIVRPDVTPPLLLLRGANPAYVEIGRTFVETNDSAYDAVDGMLTDSISYSGFITGRGYQLPISNQANAIGTFTVTAQVNDLTNNITTKTKNVIVTADTTKPTITLNGANPFYVEVYTSFSDPGATANDFFFTTPLIVSSTNNVDTSKVGSYGITYTATDVNGNNAIPVTRIVQVRDTQKPVVTFPINTDTIYAEIGSTYSDPGAMVNDNYYTGLTANWTGTVNTFIPGTYYYTFTATDGSGNVSLPKIRVIIVRDGTAPDLILASPADPDTLVIEVKRYTTVPEPGYTTVDNYYPKSQITVSKSGSVDLNKIGVYVVTYVATDPDGNSSLPKRRIYKLVDTTKPIITLNGSNTINICRWRAYTDLGATVSDNYWTGLQIVTKSNLDMNLPGTYIITFDAVDSSGNVAVTEQRVVTVLDYTSSSCQAFTGINSLDNQNLILVRPNPSNGAFNLDVSLVREQQCQITIYNSLGQIVKVVDDASIRKAKYILNLEDQSVGIYFITVKMENSTITKKIILNK